MNAPAGDSCISDERWKFSYLCPLWKMQTAASSVNEPLNNEAIVIFQTVT